MATDATTIRITRRRSGITRRRSASKKSASKKGTRYALYKRGLDLALTLVLLLAAAPIMLVVAVLVKLDSPGPIIYRQRRVGMHGVEFSMYKFRSMHVNNDDHIHRQAIKRYMEGAALNEGAEACQYKLVNDPRVTRVGRFIRRTSLDELPQLWNVLIGQMSLVGPRPPLPYEVEHYTPRALERLSGKPGLTGPWQVYARSRVSFEEMIELDIEYLQRKSLWEDIKLIALTGPVMLKGDGGA
jgi:lipopolysaccharide/colanic/teichoic acid biosynthesis glycosyltransferase